MEPFQPHAGIEVASLLLKCHQLEKRLAASAAMSVDEFHCLSQLFAHGPCCVKELCELLEVHPTRASRLLNDLERRGYVIRSLGFADKRKELLTLTPAGVAAAEQMLQSSTLSIERFSELLPDDAVRLMLSALATKDAGEHHG